MSASAHGAAPYYFVPSPSQWPAVGSFALLSFGFGAAGWVNGAAYGPWLLAAGLGILFYMMYGWFRTVAHESEGGLYNERVDDVNVVPFGMTILVVGDEGVTVRPISALAETKDLGV